MPSFTYHIKKANLRMKHKSLIIISFVACSPTLNSEIEGSIDITDAVLTNQSADCSDYMDAYYANATDIKRDLAFEGNLTISVEGGSCIFSTNSIPNHDFNDENAMFATNVSEVSSSFTVTSTPSHAEAPTDLSLELDNALFLNGVKLDLLAAACYGVGDEALGEEKIGCFDDTTPWRYDPMFSGNDFGTDSHNAHTQPDGTYHYHGSPNALFDAYDDTQASPVIGFAADGFPIFGPYIDDNGTIREVTSGYSLKSGARESQPGEGALPPGDHDGTFRDDYEFTGTGDLDECNGMTINGVYGYYVINSYPWVMACFSGTPDDSFIKR